MANIIEFLVKIKDLGSGPMRQLASNTESAFNRMSTGMRSVGKNVDSLNSKIDELTKTRNISINGRQISRLNSEIEQLEQSRNRLETRGRSGMGLLGKGLLLGGLGLAGALGIKSLNAGMDRQMAGTSFQVMAGNKQGNELHKNLIGFATDTIYGNEVFGEAKTLLGFGVAAKNVMPTMNMLGDIALGNKENMQSLSLAFAQTTAAGKLMGQDLLQYSNAGFNPLQALAQKTGKTMGYWKDQMSKGKVSVLDVVAAMQYATGPMGRFYKGMEKMGEKPAGKIMAFIGALETMAGTIGTKVLPLFGKLADIGSGILSNPGQMYAIAAAIGAMTTAWALYTTWTQSAAIWQGILAVVAFWPIAAIGLVVGLSVWAAKSFDGWGKSITGLWGVVKAFTSSVGIGFKDFFQSIIYYGELFYLKIKSVFQYIGGVIANIAQAMKLALSGDFLGAKKTLTLEVKTSASDEIKKLENERAQQHKANVLALDAYRKTAAAAWAQVGLVRSKTGAGKPATGLTSIFDPKLVPGTGGAGNAGAGAPNGVENTANGIASGGVRNITINIAKQGIDQVTIHAASVKEGAAEIRDTFIEMFNQIVNSGGAIVPSN